ncbi:MAG: transposase [Gammaproteobacteria bacterium]|nr:transposase [Gammaproteobacteria bacterium]
MIDGVLNLSLWGYVAAALIMTHITIAGVTIYLHRHQTHRGLDLHPIPSHFFRFWLWLSTGMVTKEWVAIHRKHHAKVETKDDPHSPQIYGIRKVFWQGAELYRAESKNQETLDNYGHNTPDDWLERNVYTKHSALGIAIMFVIDVVLFGAAGITIWAVQMAWIPVTAAGVINGIGHWWGYRNYECADASRNIVPWGILIGGEELHNNHHSFGSSAKLSSKWWEFDIGWLYIRILEILGLARVKKVAPEPVIVTAKPMIDMDTVRAVITHRFRVMAHYAEDVLGRVHKEEVRLANGTYRAMLKRAKALLVREESLMSEEAKHRLQSVLSVSQRLEIVYQYKQRLQEIWQRSTATQEHLLQALQEWCKQAEATGIQALQDFAQRLRGYSLQPA